MREDKRDIKRDEDSGDEQEKWETGGGKVTRTIRDLEMRKEAERDKFVGCAWIRVIVGLNLLRCVNHDRKSLESTWKHGKAIEASSRGRIQATLERRHFILLKELIRARFTLTNSRDKQLNESKSVYCFFKQCWSHWGKKTMFRPFRRPHRSPCEWEQSKWCQHKDSLNECVVVLLALWMTRSG